MNATHPGRPYFNFLLSYSDTSGDRYERGWVGRSVLNGMIWTFSGGLGHQRDFDRRV